MLRRAMEHTVLGFFSWTLASLMLLLLLICLSPVLSVLSDVVASQLLSPPLPDCAMGMHLQRISLEDVRGRTYIPTIRPTFASTGQTLKQKHKCQKTARLSLAI